MLKRNQVIKLAEHFGVDVNKILVLWLADKVIDVFEGKEVFGLEALETVKCRYKDIQVFGLDKRFMGNESLFSECKRLIYQSCFN